MIRASTLLLLLAGPLLPATSAWASAQSDIAEATRAGNSVFLVVTQTNTRGGERALQVAREAQARAPNTVVVVLDRGRAENQGLVRKYRLLGAPVPLILVVASNGIVAGGARLKDATPEVLVSIIPSPKKLEMLTHLSQKMPVFVVVSHKDMVTQRSAVFEACNKAMTQLKHKASTVVVDVDDKAEKRWLKELNIRPREKTPVTIIFNAKGQKTAVFRSAVTVEQLVKSARKKAACCPGGNC